MPGLPWRGCRARRVRPQKAPGGNPGTPGMKTNPPSMPHDSAGSPVHTRRAWHPGRYATRSPPASAGGFSGTAWVAQKAPGGNPGTPGMKTNPPSMPHDSAGSPVHTRRAWHPGRYATRSPPASTGGFSGTARMAQKAPGGNPGTPGMKTNPPSMPHDSAGSPVHTRRAPSVRLRIPGGAEGCPPAARPSRFGVTRPSRSTGLPNW